MKPIRYFLIIGATLMLNNCSQLKSTLGAGDKQAPDEFRVLKRAPLEIPYGLTLPIPQPGAPRPQEVAPQDTAKEAVFGIITGQSQAINEPNNSVQSLILNNNQKMQPIIDEAQIRTEIASELEPKTEIEVEKTKVQPEITARIAVDADTTLPKVVVPKSVNSGSVTGGVYSPAPALIAAPDNDSFLELLDAQSIDGNIRNIVEQEYQIRANKKIPIGKKLLRIGKDIEPDADIVDATAETNRIKLNKENHAPILEGETPILEH